MYYFDIANKSLQKTILTNSLINFQKKYDKYFEIDRLLKYLNNILKKDLAIRRNSIKSLDNLITKIVLTILYIFQFRVKIHDFVYRVYKNNYLEKSVSRNFQIIIKKIYKRNI